MQFLLGLLAVAIIIGLMVQFWYLAVLAILAWLTPYVIRHIRMRRYFASDEFREHREALAAVVGEHNEIASYTEEIRSGGSFEVGFSDSGSHAHLATFENVSRHGYRRDRNIAEYGSRSVHNCSLQVVRNAAADPLKYLTKYFNIKPNEPTLARVEFIGESVSRLEGAIANLERRESEISTSINPPPFILKHYHDEFMSQVGINLVPISVPYPEFVFEYVSAGGNSAQETSVRLDGMTIDALIEVLSTKIRFAKSAAGQRALMTARLRTQIKERDGYRCRHCTASLSVEPNLLLEVDHIIPVSRGGLSVVENLQTLCWRCNRSKSNKVEPSPQAI